MNRILLLYKQYFHLNNRQLLIVLGAIVALIGGFHTFMHLVNLRHLGQNHIDIKYHTVGFAFAFVGGCLIWCGHAFPGFRSKEKSIDYLMIPASSFEKFLFEFINRIGVYLICFPVVYWVITNTVTGIFHAYIPGYINYKFEYSAIMPKFDTLEMALAVSLGFLMFTIPFTGATYFQKMPLIKTILTIFLLICFYFGFGYLVLEKFGLNQYNLSNGRILFMRNADDAKLAGIWAAILVHITLLTISYFKIKEKEV